MQHVGPHDALPGAAATERRPAKRGQWIALGVLLALTYAWTLRDLVRGWMTSDHLVLGLLVLAAGAMLVWDRRHSIRDSLGRPSAWGIVALALSMLLLVAGTRAGLVFRGGMTGVFLRGLSILSFLAGAGLVLFGWGLMRHLWAPLLLAFFTFPENAITTGWLSLRLQSVAAVASEHIVGALGIVVLRQGHVLHTASFSTNVAEACSGIRSLMTIVPTAVFVGAYGLRRPLIRAALVVLAFPVAILANVVRVTSAVLAGYFIGEEAAGGLTHSLSGLALFALGLVGLLLIMVALRPLDRAGTGRDEDTGPGARAGDGKRGVADAASTGGRTAPAWGTTCLVLVLLFGVFYQSVEIVHLRAESARYPDAPLASVPNSLGRWTGVEGSGALDLELLKRHASDVLARTYSARGEAPIHVLAIYWRPDAGTLLGRRTHVPEGCYPHHGMERLWTRELALPVPERDPIAGRVSAFGDAHRKLVVTSWRQVGSASALDDDSSDVSAGRLRYGLREVFRLRGPYPPEVEVQLISPLGGAPDRTIDAHRELAVELIRNALQPLLAWRADDEGRE